MRNLSKTIFSKTKNSGFFRAIFWKKTTDIEPCMREIFFSNEEKIFCGRKAKNYYI